MKMIRKAIQRILNHPNRKQAESAVHELQSMAGKAFHRWQQNP
jgi:hypothetical protein